MPQSELNPLRILIHDTSLRKSHPEAFIKDYQKLLRNACQAVLGEKVKVTDKNLHLSGKNIPATHMPVVLDGRDTLHSFFPLPLADIPSAPKSLGLLLLLGRRNTRYKLPYNPSLANFDLMHDDVDADQVVLPDYNPTIIFTRELNTTDIVLMATDETRETEAKRSDDLTISEVHAGLLLKFIHKGIKATLVDLKPPWGTFFAEGSSPDDFRRIGLSPTPAVIEIGIGRMTPQHTIEGGDLIKLGNSSPFRLVMLTKAYANKLGSSLAIVRA